MVTGVGPISGVVGTKVPCSSTDVRCAGIMIQAWSNATRTNLGRVWIYDRLGVRIATLAIPASGSIPSYSATIPMAPGGLNVADFKIEIETTGDGVDVTYIRP